MARREFPKPVKVAAVKRATKGNVTYCENLACGLPTKRWHYDHEIPDGLGGEPTLENCKLLCLPCHAEKTAKDVADIAEAKRREANHLGVRKEPTLKSAKREKAKPQNNASRPIAKTTLPPKQMYRSEM
jgi:5-methylcytosine-specific restriction endonuclease McrA